MLRVRRQRARVARLSAWLFVSLSTLSSVAGCGGSEATARLDSKAPVVLSVSPPDPYTAVPVDANVEATFSKPIEPSAINNDTFTLVRAGSLATVSALVSYDPSTRKATKGDDAGSARARANVPRQEPQIPLAGDCCHRGRGASLRFVVASRNIERDPPPNSPRDPLVAHFPPGWL